MTQQILPAQPSVQARHLIQFPERSPMTDAHFPGHPIVPGAAVLDKIVVAMALKSPANITIKFLAPVRPGDSLELQVSTLASGSKKFELRQLTDQLCVCTGQIAA